MLSNKRRRMLPRRGVKDLTCWGVFMKKMVMKKMVMQKEAAVLFTALTGAAQAHGI
jgi:hypothetical protein